MNGLLTKEYFYAFFFETHLPAAYSLILYIFLLYILFGFCLLPYKPLLFYYQLIFQKITLLETSLASILASPFPKNKNGVREFLWGPRYR